MADGQVRITSLCCNAICHPFGMGGQHHGRTYQTYGLILYVSCIFSEPAVSPIGITTNSIALSAYAIGNAAGPFMWKKQYQPRYDPSFLHHLFNINLVTASNRVPWEVIVACTAFSSILFLVLRYMLANENKKRNIRGNNDSHDNVLLKRVDSNGSVSETKIARVSVDFQTLYSRSDGTNRLRNTSI